MTTIKKMDILPLLYSKDYPKRRYNLSISSNTINNHMEARVRSLSISLLRVLVLVLRWVKLIDSPLKNG